MWGLLSREFGSWSRASGSWLQEGCDGSRQTFACCCLGGRAGRLDGRGHRLGCIAADMARAASSRFVLQGVNTQWQVWDTAGNVQAGWPVSAQNFFGVPNVTNADGTPCDTDHRSQPFLSDPRALYDPADGRF